MGKILAYLSLSPIDPEERMTCWPNCKFVEYGDGGGDEMCLEIGGRETILLSQSKDRQFEVVAGCTEHGSG